MTEEIVFRRPPVAAVLRATARVFGVSTAEMISERRSRGIIIPRHVAMWVAYKRTGQSTPAIGRVMRRDHSTVIFGIAANEKRMAKNAELRRRVDLVLALVDKAMATQMDAPDDPLRSEVTAVVPRPAALIHPEPEQSSEPEWRHDNVCDHATRQWFVTNNARFVRAMRRAHPEREIILGAAARAQVRPGAGAPAFSAVEASR